jgi:hypothetical protein
MLLNSLMLMEERGGNINGRERSLRERERERGTEGCCFLEK